ncbi:hypothetical protein ACFSHQ_25000 [Gemmobacter lanyuensis]
MLGNAARQKQFLQSFSDRGLEVISLNANGNPCTRPIRHRARG